MNGLINKWCAFGSPLIHRRQFSGRNHKETAGSHRLYHFIGWFIVLVSYQVIHVSVFGRFRWSSIQTTGQIKMKCRYCRTLMLTFAFHDEQSDWPPVSRWWIPSMLAVDRCASTSFPDLAVPPCCGDDQNQFSLFVMNGHYYRYYWWSGSTNRMLLQIGRKFQVARKATDLSCMWRFSFKPKRKIGGLFSFDHSTGQPHHRLPNKPTIIEIVVRPWPRHDTIALDLNGRIQSHKFLTVSERSVIVISRGRSSVYLVCDRAGLQLRDVKCVLKYISHVNFARSSFQT